MISIGKPRDDRFCIVRVLSACHGGMTAWWTVAVGKIVTYIDYILCIYIYYTHISYIYNYMEYGHFAVIWTVFSIYDWCAKINKYSETQS